MHIKNFYGREKKVMSHSNWQSGAQPITNLELVLTRIKELEEKVARLESEREADKKITWEKLSKILVKGETEEVEFKKIAILKNTFHLAKSMAAIANTSGGTLFMGVTDDRKLEKSIIKDKHLETIINIARSKIDPPLNPRVYPLRGRDGDVCIAEIPKMFKGVPHRVKTRDGGVYFIRVGSTNREPSVAEMAELFQL